MRPSSAQKGFTLIETLLAITLFMIVSVSAYSVFSMGIQIWKRAGNFSKGERKVLLALEKMQEDIQNTLRKDDESKLEFKEDDKRFEFYGKADGFLMPAALQVQDADGSGLFQSGAAGYQWDARKKNLCRMTQNSTQLYQGRPPVCAVVASGIESFKLEYWIKASIGNGYSWYDEWLGKDALPQAVRLTMKTRTGADLTERKYIKTFLIPVADRPLMETKAAAA